MELGSPHEAIINVAKSGVLLALEHNMLPKPILQEALRPILTDLAFYNRINLRLLRHLHHLLVSTCSFWHQVTSALNHDTV
jgi:hypothetical protein